MARILILKDEDLAGAGSAGRGRGLQAEGIAEQRPGARGGTWTQGWEDGVDGSPGQDMAGGWGWFSSTTEANDLGLGCAARL